MNGPSTPPSRRQPPLFRVTPFRTSVWPNGAPAERGARAPPAPVRTTQQTPTPRVLFHDPSRLSSSPSPSHTLPLASLPLGSAFCRETSPSAPKDRSSPPLVAHQEATTTPLVHEQPKKGTLCSAPEHECAGDGDVPRVERCEVDEPQDVKIDNIEMGEGQEQDAEQEEAETGGEEEEEEERWEVVRILDSWYVPDAREQRGRQHIRRAKKPSARAGTRRREVYFQVEWATGEVTNEPSDMLKDGAEGVVADFYHSNPTAPGPPTWFSEAAAAGRPGTCPHLKDGYTVHEVVRDAESFTR